MRIASLALARHRFAVVALVILAACTSKPSEQGNGAAATVAASTSPAGGAALINDYPAWAAAVVPAYTSNVTSASATTADIYQIDTADPYETVLAWYKARVKTKWPDRHANETAAHMGNIAITLQKSAPPTASDKTQTIIGLIKH